MTGGGLVIRVSRSRAAADAGAPGVTWEQRDMRDLPWRGRFDGAFCVGNSFGYLDDEGNAAFSAGGARGAEARRALHPRDADGARRFCWAHVHDAPVVVGGGMVYLLVREPVRSDERSRLEIQATRSSLERSTSRSRRGSHRAFRYRELVQLIERGWFLRWTLELSRGRAVPPTT